MQTDEQLIADLTASLRKALKFIGCVAGIGENDTVDRAVSVGSVDGSGHTNFDGSAANRVLKAAAARLATIQPAPPSLALRFTPDRAAVLGEGMSDLLCWCAGFSAAISHELDRHPYGVEAVRIVREEIRAAVNLARGLPEEECPF